MSRDRIDSRRRDLRALLAVLHDAGANIAQPRRMRCPFHNDQHPSSGVFCGSDHAYRFKCWGCGVSGDVFDIESIITGRQVGELLAECEREVRV